MLGRSDPFGRGTRSVRLILLITLAIAVSSSVWAQSLPGLQIEILSGPVSAIEDQRLACDGRDFPDTPARAIRLADGSVQLYVTDQDNRINAGPDLLHLQHRCPIVYRGSGNDDPGAYDDRSWIASPWTNDGRTIWAVIHNEFHGQLRKALCPTGRYMDCWFNALTLAVSNDGGQSFQRSTGNALVAALPYRYNEVGLGHHGYFNPSNIVSFHGDLYMFAFATRANAQRAGNCLLRTEIIDRADSWRGWDGMAFATSFANPYAGPVEPDRHVCAPVGVGALRWPVTSLGRHEPTGLFIALMQDTAIGGGIYYATSPDLLRWSAPALLISAIGLPAWACGGPDAIAYPSLLDPASTDRNFETVGPTAVVFATRFNGATCHPTASRSLVRWTVRISLRN
jgi:hypothetical protein